MYYDYGWKPYVSVAERKRRAEKQKAKLFKGKGQVDPVRCEGRAVAKTFWGKSWCQNLERYSDYSNRLPRGRSYLRNGLVVDLQVKPGEVLATVSGSHLYTVKVRLEPLSKARWSSICKDCAGGIDSLVELLQGKFSQGVMERICREGTGLFPSTKEIELSCSCPDWATMCKHVAAVLYGIGVRLDEKPELLFVLRGVDGDELLARAGQGLPLSKDAPSADQVLEGEILSEMFGIEMAEESVAPLKGRKTAAKPVPAAPKRKPGTPSSKEREKISAQAPRSQPGRPQKDALVSSERSAYKPTQRIRTRREQAPSKKIPVEPSAKKPTQAKGSPRKTRALSPLEKMASVAEARGTRTKKEKGTGSRTGPASKKKTAQRPSRSR